MRIQAQLLMAPFLWQQQRQQQQCLELLAAAMLKTAGLAMPAVQASRNRRQSGSRQPRRCCSSSAWRSRGRPRASRSFLWGVAGWTLQVMMLHANAPSTNAYVRSGKDDAVSMHQSDIAGSFLSPGTFMLEIALHNC